MPASARSALATTARDTWTPRAPPVACFGYSLKGLAATLLRRRTKTCLIVRPMAHRDFGSRNHTHRYSLDDYRYENLLSSNHTPWSAAQVFLAGCATSCPETSCLRFIGQALSAGTKGRPYRSTVYHVSATVICISQSSPVAKQIANIPRPSCDWKHLDLSKQMDVRTQPSGCGIFRCCMGAFSSCTTHKAIAMK